MFLALWDTSAHLDVLRPGLSLTLRQPRSAGDERISLWYLNLKKRKRWRNGDRRKCRSDYRCVDRVSLVVPLESHDIVHGVCDPTTLRDFFFPESKNKTVCHGNRELLFWSAHLTLSGQEESLSPRWREWRGLLLSWRPSTESPGNLQVEEIDIKMNIFINLTPPRRFFRQNVTHRRVTCRSCRSRRTGWPLAWPNRSALKAEWRGDETRGACGTPKHTLIELFSYFSPFIAESDISNQGQSKEVTSSSSSSSSSSGNVEAIVGAVDNGPLNHHSNEQPGRWPFVVFLLKCRTCKPRIECPDHG